MVHPCLIKIQNQARRVGATVARPPPERKVGCSNHSLSIFVFLLMIFNGNIEIEVTYIDIVNKKVYIYYKIK